MSEVKFRAWDTEREIMIYDYDQKTAEIYNMLPGEWIHEKVYKIGMLNGTLMQYTGLNDNNGKEIYEGDICRFDNGDTFAVDCEEWVEFYGKWIGEPECEDQLRDWYRASSAAVIGNIYEGSDLL